MQIYTNIGIYKYAHKYVTCMLYSFVSFVCKPAHTYTCIHKHI
jgi:hypothetical protein